MRIEMWSLNYETDGPKPGLNGAASILDMQIFINVDATRMVFAVHERPYQSATQQIGGKRRGICERRVIIEPRRNYHVYHDMFRDAQIVGCNSKSAGIFRRLNSGGWSPCNVEDARVEQRNPFFIAAQRRTKRNAIGDRIELLDKIAMRCRRQATKFHRCTNTFAR